MKPPLNIIFCGNFKSSLIKQINSHLFNNEGIITSIEDALYEIVDNPTLLQELKYQEIKKEARSIYKKLEIPAKLVPDSVITVDKSVFEDEEFMEVFNSSSREEKLKLLKAVIEILYPNQKWIINRFLYNLIFFQKIKATIVNNNLINNIYIFEVNNFEDLVEILSNKYFDSIVISTGSTDTEIVEKITKGYIEPFYFIRNDEFLFFTINKSKSHNYNFYKIYKNLQKYLIENFS